MSEKVQLNINEIQSNVNKVGEELARLLENIHFEQTPEVKTNNEFIKSIVEENKEIKQFVVKLVNQFNNELNNLESGVQLLGETDTKIKQMVESKQIKTRGKF